MAEKPAPAPHADPTFVDVTVTIQTGATINPLTAEGVHTRAAGGDWVIQLIDPASPVQAVAHEYRGAAPIATFQLISGETWNIRAERLDQAGKLISAIMFMGYVVGSGPAAPIEVPTAISVA